MSFIAKSFFSYFSFNKNKNKNNSNENNNNNDDLQNLFKTTKKQKKQKFFQLQLQKITKIQEYLKTQKLMVIII